MPVGVPSSVSLRGELCRGAPYSLVITSARPVTSQSGTLAKWVAGSKLRFGPQEISDILQARFRLWLQLLLLNHFVHPQRKIIQRI
jgi:hypothetical protein